MAIAGRLEPHPLVVGAAAAAQVDGRAAAVSELAEAAASWLRDWAYSARCCDRTICWKARSSPA